MKRRFVSPLAVIESRSDAQALQMGSALGFALWAVVLIGHFAAVMAGLGTVGEAERGATAGLAFWLAAMAAVLGVVQARRPNRLMPVIGLAWSLFELSSMAVSLMVGAPLALGGLPAWAGALTAGALLLALLLHIGALRAHGYLAKSA